MIDPGCGGKQDLIDIGTVRAVVLINYVRRHHVLALKEISRRVGALTILVSTPMEGDRSWEPEWDGLDVRVQKNWTVTMNRSAGFQEKNFIHFPVDTLRQLRRLKPDVVFSYEMGMRTMLCGISRALHPDTPLVLVGNMAESLEKNRGPVRRAMRKLIKSRVDYCTYNGPSCRRYLNSIGVDDSRLFYFPYCYDPETTHDGEKIFSSDDVRRLLFCGALSERKAILPLVQNLVTWCAANPSRQIELAVAGDGALREQVQSLTRENLQLRMLGNLDASDLRTQYAMADICVFPSMGDEWGLVPVEAWASGLPVLGSQYAQSVETICRHGANGWMFKPDSSADAFSVLDEALNTPVEALRSMSVAARDSVRSFTPQNSADRFCDIVQHALHANLSGIESPAVNEFESNFEQPQDPNPEWANPIVARSPAAAHKQPVPARTAGKSLCSVSLDLDNKWSYLKSHGDARWESFPSYLNLIVPRILRVLDDLDMKITFFVVGQDAVIEENQAALRMLVEGGHEIANHSFHHEPCLHLYTPDQIDREFELSEAAIERVTGRRTIGFRGPGFSLSDQTLKTLVRRGYRYDCTTFPTYLAPVARAYYFMTGSFSSKEKQERGGMFGKFSDGFLPNRPYLWSGEGRPLLEIPVSTFPGFKVPIHATYLQYLSGYSTLAASAYWSTALAGFQLTGASPSILLHPLDFLGGDEEPDLKFFPAMQLSSKTKIKRMYRFLGTLRDRFDVLTMQQFAGIAVEQQLAHRSISLARSGIS